MMVMQLFLPNANILDTVTIPIVTENSVGIMSRGKIEDKLNTALEQQRLLALNISKSQLDSAKSSANIQFSNIKGKNNSDDEQGLSAGVGYVSGFLIYIVLFIYGTMVMRGVMEEKVSRIAEVIVSSVKPFQLMMGKILGIGAVGLVQFIIWIILMIGLNFLLPVYISRSCSSNAFIRHGTGQHAGSGCNAVTVVFCIASVM